MLTAPSENTEAACAPDAILGIEVTMVRWLHVADRALLVASACTGITER